MNELRDLIQTIDFPVKNLGKSKSPPKGYRSKAKKAIEKAQWNYALGKLFIALHIRNKLDDPPDVKEQKAKAEKANQYFTNIDDYMILKEIARNCYGMRTKKDCDIYRKEGVKAFRKNYKTMAYAFDLYNEYTKVDNALQKSSSQRSSSQRSSSQRSSPQRSYPQRLTDKEVFMLFDKEMENVSDKELAEFRGSIESTKSNYNSARSSFSKSNQKEGGKNNKSKKVIKKKNSTNQKKSKKLLKKKYHKK